MGEKQSSDERGRLQRLSLHPLNLDEALAGAMEVSPPQDGEAEKQKEAKKVKGKKKRRK